MKNSERLQETINKINYFLNNKTEYEQKEEFLFFLKELDEELFDIKLTILQEEVKRSV